MKGISGYANGFLSLRFIALVGSKDKAKIHPLFACL
jgi:hypothetical protein